MEIQGNLLQGVVAGIFVVALFGFCAWQMVSTSRAKKRRIARESAEKSERQSRT